MHRAPVAIILALISIGGNITAFSTPQYHTRTQQPKHQLSTSTLFAGGGFGATSKKSSTAPSKKKKGKKSKSSGLLDLEVSTPSKEETAGPKLDRFGLPLPTEDDVFPPLSPDIKRIAADNVDEFNQDDVAEAIKNHLGVNLNVFDKDGYSTHEEEEGNNNRWKLKLLHNDPPVFQIDNFFTEDECQSYMSMVDPQSKHDDQQQQSNAVQMTSPTFSSLSISRRTSTTWFCRYKSVTTLLAKAQRLLNNVELNQFEEPQVVRYRTGEEFSWHYDEIPKTQLANGGQRLATLLVYLNDLEEDRGGGTVFRDLAPPTTTTAGGSSISDKNKGKKSKRSKGNTTSNNNNQHLTVRPRTGTALLFFPSYTDGTPDQRTLHKGEVALDTKMIAQLWIHENEYQAGVPEGNLQSDAVDGVEREAARLGFI